jgi:hypothetical protein
MPPVAVAAIACPSPTNALGVKGAGEAGTTGAIAALGNAVADALAHAGHPPMDMPFTPARVWRHDEITQVYTGQEQGVICGGRGGVTVRRRRRRQCWRGCVRRRVVGRRRGEAVRYQSGVVVHGLDCGSAHASARRPGPGTAVRGVLAA